MENQILIYYSPEGNPEMWREGTQPEGYLTKEQWEAKEEAAKQAYQEELLRQQNTYEYRYEEKLDEINAKFREAMQDLHELYPEYEEDTFNMQLNAANAYLATQNTESAEYKFLRTMANAREITVLQLIEKIRNKANAYETKVAELVGTRHKYLDTLKSFSNTINPQVIKDMEVTY